MEEIKKIVEELVDNFRSFNPFVIAKKSNITILHRDLGNIKGFYKKINDIKFIALNDNLSEFLTFVVLSHELGHSFLHEDSDSFDYKFNFIGESSRLEKEANYFAALLCSYNEENFYLEDEYEERIYRNLISLL